MSKLGKLARGVAKVTPGLAAAGTAVAGLLVFGEDGRLNQVKLGELAVWDRRRWEQRPMVKRIKARIAARRARRAE